MKCYYEPSEDAVGVCKSCGKGLSPAYAVDLGRGLACKGRCEDDVRKLITLIEQNQKMSSASAEILTKSPTAAYGQAGFLVVAGLIFGGFGIYRDQQPFLLGLGALFLVYGISVFVRAKRIAEAMQKK